MLPEGFLLANVNSTILDFPEETRTGDASPVERQALGFSIE
jgi:hypothetical protein